MFQNAPSKKKGKWHVSKLPLQEKGELISQGRMVKIVAWYGELTGTSHVPHRLQENTPKVDSKVSVLTRSGHCQGSRLWPSLIDDNCTPNHSSSTRKRTKVYVKSCDPDCKILHILVSFNGIVVFSVGFVFEHKALDFKPILDVKMRIWSAENGDEKFSIFQETEFPLWKLYQLDPQLLVSSNI